MKAVASLSLPTQAPQGGFHFSLKSGSERMKGAVWDRDCSTPHSDESVSCGSFIVGRPPSLSGPQSPHE